MLSGLNNLSATKPFILLLLKKTAMKAEDFILEYQHVLKEKLAGIHKKQLQQSKEKGEEDGKRNLPSVEDTFTTPVEHEIRNKYQAEIEVLYENGKQVLNDLSHKEMTAIQQELLDFSEQKTELRIKEAEKDRDHQLEELTNNHLDKIKDIENTPHYQEHKKRFEKIEQRWETISEKHNRQELNIQFKPYWAYVLLLFAIGIAEFPLNNQVFISFRETPLLTLIMAGVLVVTLPFLAHATGKFLKQVKERKFYPAVLIILVAAIITISYFTALLRAGYLSELGVSEDQLFLDRWTFFTIGIILYLVGSIASFFAHDDSNEFYEVYKKYHAEEKQFLVIQKEINTQRTQEKENYDVEKRKIQQAFLAKTEELKNRLQHLQQKKTEVAGDYNKILAFCQGMERKINNNFKEAIFNYRDTNLTFRNNHKQPKSWGEILPDLQGHFVNIDELKQTETR